MTLARLLELPNVARRNASLRLAHLLIGSRPTDQYIVSFPRSGSTWLRAMLAGIIDPERGFEPSVFNRALPGVSGRRLPLVWVLPNPRILHSHITYSRLIKRAVYMVRDGRDALVSFYHYTVTRQHKTMPFDDWLSLYWKRWYGPRWHDSVESWLIDGRKRLGSNLMVLRFEDIRASPELQLQRVAEFLGLKPDESAITHAVRMTTLARSLKREEKSWGTSEDPNARFFRDSSSGQWRQVMNCSMHKYFMRVAGRAMELAGYVGGEAEGGCLQNCG